MTTNSSSEKIINSVPDMDKSVEVSQKNTTEEVLDTLLSQLIAADMPQNNLFLGQRPRVLGGESLRMNGSTNLNGYDNMSCIMICKWPAN